MPINIRLSGAIDDDDSKDLRKTRAKLLYRLFSSGFNIYNGNGDQDVHLWNIQKKIIEADGFVFMPGAKLDDLVKASSIFVGYQTGDQDLDGKPSVMINPSGSWDHWLALIDHLHVMGTVSQNRDDLLTIVKKSKEAVKVLKEKTVAIEKIKTTYKTTPPEKNVEGDKERAQPDFSVCVFCSASTTNPDFLKSGYRLGELIAESGWGCVSGAGRTGIMGEVVRGAYENDGWTGGSNIPHIIKLEGLPDGINHFWPTDDIYKRMEVMIEKSDGFVIMPGGMGTVQETLVLLDLKKKNDPLMKGKPIVIVNSKCRNDAGQNIGFWEPLIAIAEKHKAQEHFETTSDVESIIKILKH